MYTNNKIPFGLKNGILVDVSEVDSGLACHCLCPKCHRKLQANKGRLKSHYFSHDPCIDTNNCESAYETAIHMMAKQIIFEEKRIMLPKLSVFEKDIDDNGKTHVVDVDVTETKMITFDQVKVERKIDKYKPDILAENRDIKIIIEIAVSHKVEAQKLSYIRENNYPAIEVNLSKIDDDLDKIKLKEILIDTPDNKKWLCHPRFKESKKKAINLIKRKIIDENNNIRESIIRNNEYERRNRALARREEYLKSLERIKVSKRNKKIEFDIRWFVCESCGKTFNKTKEEVPYGNSMTECPYCSNQVSTKSKI